MKHLLLATILLAAHRCRCDEDVPTEAPTEVWDSLASSKDSSVSGYPDDDNDYDSSATLAEEEATLAEKDATPDDDNNYDGDDDGGDDDNDNCDHEHGRRAQRR